MHRRGHRDGVSATDRTRVLSGLDHADGVGHDAGQRKDTGCLDAAGAVEEFPADDHQGGRPVVVEREQCVHQPAELADGIVGCAQCVVVSCVEVGGDALQDRAVQRLLRGVVVQQPGVAEVRGPRDAGQARAFVAVSCERLLGLGEDPGSGVDGQTSMTWFGSGLRWLGAWL